MTETNQTLEVNEYIEPGLRYTEEVGQTVRSLPVRYCYLWRDDVEDPVSDMELISFKQRFGAVSVAAEGIGGVETLPQFRRQGYMTKLLKKAAEGLARRVDVAFVSEAIEGVYEKFGFVPSLADASLALAIRDLETSLGPLNRQQATEGIRNYTPKDLPDMIRLYNEIHAQRPWTHERQVSWNRLIEPELWKPGSEILVFEQEGTFKGYAILQGRLFGHPDPTYVVDELTAADAPAARQLLAAVAWRCWQLRLGEFLVCEPFDSVVGREARRLGCRYHQSYPASGAMMVAVINRVGLLNQLEPELRRRSAYASLVAEHEAAFDLLLRGDLTLDNRTLLRLLLGYESAADAQAAGMVIPPRYERICAAWFPGGGGPALPAPYAHKLDRY